MSDARLSHRGGGPVQSPPLLQGEHTCCATLLRMSLLGVGVYPVSQAARLAGVNTAAVRRWLLGYSRQGKSYPPLWKPEVDPDELGEHAIGFRDLLELRLVAAFEHRGVSLRVIRATVEFARQEFGTAYPLTAKRFLTDGRTIFLEAKRAAGEEEMIDVPKKQLVFGDIIRPSLYEGIEYEDEGTSALRWFPLGMKQRAIVLDPKVQFGSPIVASAGVPTDTIAASVKAEGGDRKAVARIYGISPQEVAAAVRFETQLAA